MKVKNFSSRKGFSLVEISLVMAIIMALAGLYALNIDAQKQTAQQEAEKLARYLHDLERKADRTHRGFFIKIEKDSIKSYWNDESEFNLNDGKKIYWKSELQAGEERPIIEKGFTVDDEGTLATEVTYNPNDNKFNKKGRFKVIRDSDLSKYYVIINGWRIRLSENPPD